MSSVAWPYLLGILAFAIIVICVSALLPPLEWVRRCPICRAVMRQQYGDRGPWVCGNCGWSH